MQPHITCRRDLFNKEGPCNEERREKCNKRKDEWLDCLDKAVGTKENLKLKKQYQNNDTAIKEFPKDKLV